MVEQGDLQHMEKSFLADALATVFGALAGTTLPQVRILNQR